MAQASRHPLFWLFLAGLNPYFEVQGAPLLLGEQFHTVGDKPGEFIEEGLYTDGDALVRSASLVGVSWASQGDAASRTERLILDLAPDRPISSEPLITRLLPYTQIAVDPHRVTLSFWGVANVEIPKVARNARGTRSWPDLRTSQCILKLVLIPPLEGEPGGVPLTLSLELKGPSQVRAYHLIQGHPSRLVLDIIPKKP